MTQRTNEIGVRIALGAEPSGIQRLVVVQRLRMVLIGLGLGLVGAVIVTGILGSLLYEVNPRDPMTFAVVTLLLVVVAVGAGRSKCGSKAPDGPTWRWNTVGRRC